MSASWFIFAVAGLAVLGSLITLVRMGWRLLRGDEEMEPGGSFGTLLRRDRNTTPKG